MTSQKVYSIELYSLLLSGVCFILSHYAAAQLPSSKDCLPILEARDYYSYAQQNNLQEDYLRTIDAETYQQLKTDNKLSLLGLTDDGVFKLEDGYDSFNEIRNKYLDNTHYSRNQQQALDILQETVNPRAYPAYKACLESLGESGQPIRAYANSENTDQIELNVTYHNPTGVKSKVLTGVLLEPVMNLHQGRFFACR